MTGPLQPFLNAVQFMTIVPPLGGERFHHEWLLPAARYFPLVGALIGLACGAVLWASSLIWSGAVPAALAAAGRLLQSS